MQLIPEQPRWRILVAACLATLVSSARPATAYEYEVFVDVDTEEDLYDLLANGQLTEDSFDTLLALYRAGVDLNRDGRERLYTLPNLTYRDVDAILAYRKEAGSIPNPILLVTNNIISQRKFLAISPFLIVRDPKRSIYATDGRAQVGSLFSTRDDRFPATFMRARVSTFKNFTFGFQSIVQRTRVANVVYDPARDALAADPPATRFRVPKLFARWETDNIDAIAGHYRIGFGERLTFDNTSEYDPHGIYFDDQAINRPFGLSRRCKESQGELAVSPCSGDARNEYITPDFSLPQRLAGAAVGFKNIPVSTGKISAHAFASYQPKSIYQYELYRPDRCSDPKDDNLDECAAPHVFNSTQDPLGHASRFSFQTLPNMYRETVAGANVTFEADPRVHFGLTGYGAATRFLTTGIELDFQEWSRLPYGGPFGAVGFDMAWGRNWLDLFFEAAHSFDKMADGGGGPAAVVRATATKKKQELEVSARYYDTKFANPFARPISAPDLHDGLRARDEAGFRVRYNGNLSDRVRLRTSADFWRSQVDDAFRTDLLSRISFRSSSVLRFGGWARYQDRDLSEGGRMQCYETPVDEDERGEPIPCAGQKMQWAGFFRVQPTKKYWVSGQLTHRILDEDRGSDYDDRYRQDITAWLKVIVKPVDGVRLSARMRYLNEAVRTPDFLEESVWTYFDITYRLRKKTYLRFRYDIFAYIDDRTSTADRVPNPEHWLYVDLRSRF